MNVSGVIDYGNLSGSQKRLLRETLLDAFADPRAFDQVMKDNDLPRLSHMTGGGPVPLQYGEAIEDLEARGKLAMMVEAIRNSDYGGNARIVEIETRLALADTRTEDQAKRHGGGLSLERMVSRGGIHNLLEWSERLAALWPAVCRISYPLGGRTAYGTGFLIAPDRALTNFHVMEPVIAGRVAPAEVSVIFGYGEGAAGIVPGTPVPLAEDWKGPHAPYAAGDTAVGGTPPGPDELDLCVIRLARAPGAAPVDISKTLPPEQTGIVYIIQHARGRPVGLSIGQRSRIDGTPANRLRYDADTLGGSSGALVTGGALEPIALHHAGDPDDDRMAAFNQGIPLNLIHAWLERRSDAAA